MVAVAAGVNQSNNWIHEGKDSRGNLLKVIKGELGQKVDSHSHINILHLSRGSLISPCVLMGRSWTQTDQMECAPTRRSETVILMVWIF